MMTPDEAKGLGYEVIQASAFEVGLVKNGRGLRTWWNREFNGKLPGLDHPIIQHHIQIQEDMEQEFLRSRPKL